MSIRLRITNKHEIRVANELMGQGYTIYKRGWPDFMAVRGDELLLVEVKSPKGKYVSPAQEVVAKTLLKHGLKVVVAFGTIDDARAPESRRRRK